MWESEQTARIFVPDNIIKNSKSVNIFETLMQNARISQHNIENMKKMLAKRNQHKTPAPASTRIFNEIVADRRFDQYGYRSKGDNRSILKVHEETQNG